MGPFHILAPGVFPSRMLGVNQDEGFKEAVRLYLMLHADHEGATHPPAMMQILVAFRVAIWYAKRLGLLASRFRQAMFFFEKCSGSRKRTVESRNLSVNKL